MMMFFLHLSYLLLLNAWQLKPGQAHPVARGTTQQARQKKAAPIVIPDYIPDVDTRYWAKRIKVRDIAFLRFYGLTFTEPLDIKDPVVIAGFLHAIQHAEVRHTVPVPGQMFIIYNGGRITDTFEIHFQPDAPVENDTYKIDFQIDNPRSAFCLEFHNRLRDLEPYMAQKVSRSIGQLAGRVNSLEVINDPLDDTLLVEKPEEVREWMLTLEHVDRNEFAYTHGEFPSEVILHLDDKTEVTFSFILKQCTSVTEVKATFPPLIAARYNLCKETEEQHRKKYQHPR